MHGLAANLALSPTEVWAAMEKDPRWADWQEGRISPYDWHLHVNKGLGCSLNFVQFAEAWTLAMCPEPLLDSALFAKLSKRYRLGLLSNTDPIHVAHMEPRYDFFKFFPVRTYSCVVAASKPSPLIFREGLRASRVQAQDAVFFHAIPATIKPPHPPALSALPIHSPYHLPSL